MFFLFGIVVIIIGIVNIVYPQFAWYLKEGWKVDGDSEPSDLYLMMSRISGVAALFMGIFIMFT